MVKDFHQGDLVAVVPRAAAGFRLWGLSLKLGDVVVFGPHDEGEPWGLVLNGPK